MFVMIMVIQSVQDPLTKAASGLLENLEDMFPLYHMHIICLYQFKSSTNYIIVCYPWRSDYSTCSLLVTIILSLEWPIARVFCVQKLFLSQWYYMVNMLC